MHVLVYDGEPDSARGRGAALADRLDLAKVRAPLVLEPISSRNLLLLRLAWLQHQDQPVCALIDLYAGDESADRSGDRILATITTHSHLARTRAIAMTQFIDGSLTSLLDTGVFAILDWAKLCELPRTASTGDELHRLLHDPGFAPAESPHGWILARRAAEVRTHHAKTAEKLWNKRVTTPFHPWYFQAIEALASNTDQTTVRKLATGPHATKFRHFDELKAGLELFAGATGDVPTGARRFLLGCGSRPSPGPTITRRPELDPAWSDPEAEACAFLTGRQLDALATLRDRYADLTSAQRAGASAFSDACAHIARSEERDPLELREAVDMAITLTREARSDLDRFPKAIVLARFLELHLRAADLDSGPRARALEQARAAAGGHAIDQWFDPPAPFGAAPSSDRATPPDANGDPLDSTAIAERLGVLLRADAFHR
ncbi:hypothetical protein GKE82_24320 [Conexibacter sp. W3-3-2]|uniref:hypothetical protein n=1 Tax=Conexibacter sp. W3-3-2 TaxID=2675227 RepID=UPI0012B76436|nr:hypothetical protein [Conexibacter sp. W3-3-2]MTD47335.1 hypothetical protein [Conexibacter sp. W3-3-2]